MINQWLEQLKNTPERLAEQREKLSSKRTQITYNAKVRAHTVRDDSAEAVWTLRARALSRVGNALDKAHDVPVLGKLTEPAARLVTDRLETLTTPPVEDYDGQNAKTLVSIIRALDSRIALAAIRRYESANKARKTVLAAVEARITALPNLAAAA